MLTVIFVGGGRVTRILAGGWIRAGRAPERVLVHDPSGEALEALEAAVPSIERVSLESAARADVVFVALHPPKVVEALTTIRPWLRGDAVVVSLAPKIPLGALAGAAGTPRVARLIPNAPSLVGRGYNPVTFGPGIDAGVRKALLDLFAPWGRTPEVPEAHLEAYAVLTAMGPTYFWYQWQALRDVASALGLAAADADVALREMTDGALATLLDAGLTPAATMDLIPVRPLADLEPGVTAAYRGVLPSLHAKIRPVETTLA